MFEKVEKVELEYIFLRNNGSCWKVKVLTPLTRVNSYVAEMRLNLENQFNIR